MVRSKFMAVVLGLGLAGTMAVPTFAQDGGGNPPANQGGGRGNRGPRMSPEEMRAAMATQMKESMGATDAEWAVLGPKVEKLQTISMASRGGMGMPGGRGRGGAGGGPGAAAADPNRPSSPVGEATRELRTLLENKDATVEQIKVKLATLRDAKAKAKEELTKAQTELREVLNVRQEAVLVSWGLLD